MPELHLKQPGLQLQSFYLLLFSIYCGPFTKHLERIQKFRETANLKHLYRNELDKAWFTHDAAYCDSKDLAKRTISDKILKGRADEMARNRVYNGYQRV